MSKLNYSDKPTYYPDGGNSPTEYDHYKLIRDCSEYRMELRLLQLEAEAQPCWATDDLQETTVRVSEPDPISHVNRLIAEMRHYRNELKEHIKRDRERQSDGF